MGAAELRVAYAAGRLSPVEVVCASLDRAEVVHARFNAFSRIDREAAVSQAQASEDRWRRGKPLSGVDGIPATIKDLVWVKGWPIRLGSRTTGDATSEYDAPAVARLRSAGVIFLGLTTTPEFGWKAVTDGPLTGVTRNPWNPDLTPGGSSGGAAVAAATGAGVFHLGTDGGGSIRIPSSFTGVVGMKPTYGRVPAYPASAFGTLAHLGPITRRTADAQAMLAAMAGTDLEDWLQGPATLSPLTSTLRTFEDIQLGVWSMPPCGTVDTEIAASFREAITEFERVGAKVAPVDLPEGDLLDTFTVLWAAGAAARVSALSPADRKKLDPGLRELVAEGESYDAVRYVQATATRTEFGRAMEALTGRYDLLISPAVAVVPFHAGLEVPPGSRLKRWIEWAGFSFPLNLSQQPAAVVPWTRTSSGLPIGIQFFARRGEDARVLDYAQAFEAGRPDAFL